MARSKGQSEFVQWMAPLLDALRAMGGQEAVDQVNQNALANAAVTTVISAGAGAAIGGAFGNAGAGALGGLGAGLLGGGGIGGRTAVAGNSTLQQLYDNAFLQCHYSKHNQVPSGYNYQVQ